MKNIRQSVNCSNCKHVVYDPGAYDDGTYYCNVTNPSWPASKRREAMDRYQVYIHQVCDLHEAKGTQKL